MGGTWMKSACIRGGSVGRVNQEFITGNPIHQLTKLDEIQ